MTPRNALALLLGAALAVGVAPADAAPHKVLVLPLDGNADAATRTRLTAQVARLAKGLDGQVGTAEATFADTALAVGCDPRAARCSDDVMATLGVDELVWGTATRDGGQTRLVVRRAARGTAAREVSTTIAAGEPADKIDARLAPVFSAPGAGSPAQASSSARSSTAGSSTGSSAAASSSAGSPPAAPSIAGSSVGASPGADARGATTSAIAPSTVAPTSGSSASVGGPGPAPVPFMPPPAEDHRDRNVGIALVAGGGVSFALGLALFASYASLQDQVDNHATRNRSDFDDLTALEDRAQTYAIAGDIAVVVGVVAGGLGAYYLLRSPRRHRVAVVPMALGRGGGLVLALPGGW
jgi:hypothetical protein